MMVRTVSNYPPQHTRAGPFSLAARSSRQPYQGLCIYDYDPLHLQAMARLEQLPAAKGTLTAAAKI